MSPTLCGKFTAQSPTLGPFDTMFAIFHARMIANIFLKPFPKVDEHGMSALRKETHRFMNKNFNNDYEREVKTASFHVSFNVKKYMFLGTCNKKSFSRVSDLAWGWLILLLSNSSKRFKVPKLLLVPQL